MSCLCFLSMFWSQWTLFIGAAIFAAYKWSTHTYDFFAKRNIEFEKPVPLLGNIQGIILHTESVFDLVKRLYLKFKDRKFAGTFELRNPFLMINDPDLIKQITVKDFDYFVNHRRFLDPDSEPLIGCSLFALNDQKWRDMRATLSPAFTGSKMRQMFQLIEECGKNVTKHLKQRASTGGLEEIDMMDFFSRFTNDVIGSCAFGIQIDSLMDKDNEFYRMGRKATNFSGFTTVKFFLFLNFAGLMKFFRVRLFDQKFSSYFNNLVLDTMKHRNEHGIVRQDMINLLMQARKGILDSSDVGKVDAVDGFATVQESSVGQKFVHRNWTDSEIVAQCFLFFLAGFQATASMMCFCAHELMENPDVQEKLFEEIAEVRKELNGNPLTYEALLKMKYMDMVVSETVRKWPQAVAADRICTKPYTIKDNSTNQVIHVNPGDIISIPIAGIHNNPDYFPYPNKFDPERFSDDNKDNIKPFTYMPFGLGPRNCIGSRFALMETKAIIFYLLSEFRLDASAKSTIPIKLAPAGFQLQNTNGFWLKFVPRT